MYKCKLDNKETIIRDGFTINEEMNEKLDSGTFQFLSKGGESNIEPFDSVIFEANEEMHTSRKKLLIDVFENEIQSYNDSLENSDYFYTSNVFSESKELERITLPDLTITKRPDGTIVSVWDKIKQYCKQYLPRIYVYDKNEPTKRNLVCKYMYDIALEEKFSMECPEMSWQAPTLKEVLTGLFQVADCIPVLKDNVLTFFDLTYRGKEIDQSKLNDCKSSASSADYSDELTIPMKNTIQKTTTKVEYITARTINSSEMTTDNMCLITQKPIYKIKSFKIYAGASGTGLVEHELINRRGKDFIVEDEIYKILKPRRKRIPLTTEIYDYQAFVLHYKRGTNIIDGLGESIEFSTGNGLTPHTDSRVSLAFGASDAYLTGDTTGNVYTRAIKDTNTRKVLFRIEYETIDETTLHVGKLDQIKHPTNRLFDGQNGQTVDLGKQTIHEYLKANRLGNKIKTIFGHYTDERDIPELADTIGEMVLFSRSITYWDGILYFKGELIDNYILRDYFTGVISKRRSWAIASEQESVIRHDVFKFYVVAGFAMASIPTQDKYKVPYYLSGDYVHVLSILGSNRVEATRNINGVVIQTSGKEGTMPSANDFVIMETNINVIGRSFICDFGFVDNAVAGYSITRESSTEFIGGIVQYCDSNGEADKFNITLCNYISATEHDPEGEMNRLIEVYLRSKPIWESDEGQRIWDKVNDYSNKKPLTTLGAFNPDYHLQIASNYYYKDNREKVKASVQFEFTSEEKGLIVTDKLASYCDFVYSGTPNLKIYKLENDKYRPTETVVRGVHMSDWSLTSFFYNSSNYQTQEVILSDRNQLSRNDAWCVCDANDNILFAVNTPLTRFIYFSVRLTRDNNVYNSQVDRVPIGKIYNADLDQAYLDNQPEVESINVLGRIVPISDFKDFTD